MIFPRDIKTIRRTNEPADGEAMMRDDSFRTIPDEAWEHVTPAVFHEGHLVPDLSTGYRLGEDPEVERWLSYFTVENWREWSGAVILCGRAPSYEGMFFRFDEVGLFIRHGYRNPYREPGVPDWYFFWVRDYGMGEMKSWCRSHGFLPSKDLIRGEGGYGISTGLRGELDGLVTPHTEPVDRSTGLQGYVGDFIIPDKWWQSTEALASGRQHGIRRARVRSYADKVWGTLKAKGCAWRVDRFVAIIGVACPRMDNVTPAFAAETVKPIIDAGTTARLWEDDDSFHRHSTIYFQLPEQAEPGTHRLVIYIIPVPKQFHVAGGIAVSATREWDSTESKPEGFDGYTITFAIPKSMWLTSNITDSALITERRKAGEDIPWGSDKAVSIRRNVADSLMNLAKRTWVDQGFTPSQRFMAVAGIQYPRSNRSDPDNAAETIAQILKAGAEVGAWEDTSSQHCHAVAFYKMPGLSPGDYHIVQFLIFPIPSSFHVASAIAETATKEWESIHKTTGNQ